MFELDIFEFVSISLRFSENLYYPLDICIYFLYASLELEHRTLHSQELIEKAEILDNLSQINKVPADKIQEKIEKLTTENKNLSSKLEDMETARAKDSFSALLPRAKDVNNIKILISKIDDFNPNAIRSGMELMANKLGRSVVVLCSMKSDGTVFVNAKVDNDLIKLVQAGKIVGDIARALGGNGGGKPQMAQGLGKTQQGIDEILSKVEGEILEILK